MIRYLKKYHGFTDEMIKRYEQMTICYNQWTVERRINTVKAVYGK